MQETETISSSPSSSTSDGDPATSSRSPEVSAEGDREGDADVEEARENSPLQTSIYYRVQHALRPPRGIPASAVVDDLPADDTLSCIIVILTFWFFVSITLIMGIFGSEDLQLGPYSSILLHPNPLFVHSLEIETKEIKFGPVLYGFYRAPPLDITKTWSASLNASIKPNTHEEWVYYLNEGSQISISYNVPSSSSLLLIIAKGNEGMAEWLEDPSYPNSALSWNIIRGSGTIKQDILKPYDYHVAIGNLNFEDVEVDLDIWIRSSMYDITDSYYKCNLTRGLCHLNILFPGGNAAVLTTSGPEEGAGTNELIVKLSYEPRWTTYLLGIGGMTSIMLWAFNFLNRFRSSSEVTRETESRDLGPERAPLLSQKDDDLSSLGSSYDSASQNDEEQEYLEEGYFEGKPVGESGKKYNPKQLCVICFDASRDSFFIPCGHCACCFTCGARIAEDFGTCPICRRKTKKVKRIYSV